MKKVSLLTVFCFALHKIYSFSSAVKLSDDEYVLSQLDSFPGQLVLSLS